MLLRTLQVMLLVMTLSHFPVASAFQPAPMRVCRIAGGLYWVLNMGQPDDFALCRFGGPAIGAVTFFMKVANGQHSQALDAYLKTGINRAVSPKHFCETAGGNYAVMTDSESVSFAVCRFEDGSGMEASTLQSGAESPRNRVLTDALTPAPDTVLKEDAPLLY